MITVAILINSNPIMARSATNIGEVEDDSGCCRYQVDTGAVITHNPDDGAVALAKKLLDTIYEQGVSNE
jgi:hypothetical protein